MLCELVLLEVKSIRTFKVLVCFLGLLKFWKRIVIVLWNEDPKYSIFLLIPSK